jgi:hypothetical protein
MSDPDFDDRCDDEQREADISRRTRLTAWRPMECRLILMMMATRRTHEPCGFYLASYTRQPLCRIRRH